MTVITFENARLIDPDAGTDAPGMLVVRGGVIVQVNGPRPATGERLDCGGLPLAPGIVDLGVKVGEPGERHKEGFRSAGRAAAAGGVTTIVTRPDTAPALDTPEALVFLRSRARDRCGVNVAPMAALTKGREGREMTEIGFLRDAGAVAFTDCDRVAEDTRVLSRALSYAGSLGALTVAHVQEPILSAGAAATSGAFATLRGLPGVSPMAERMGLERLIALAEMTGAPVHADQITCRAALPALRRAKGGGADLTAGTSIHHLCLNALDVGPWRTFFKVKPPLRPEEDRVAVVEALLDGTIDVLSSWHTPQDEESKRLPFEAAASGAVGLQTLLPAALRLHHEGLADLPALFRAMSLNPARRLGLAGGRLAEGAPADLTLFDPDAPWRLDRWTLLSKSKNTPFDGALLQGRVLGTWVGGARVWPEPERPA
ncbi:dihydroorotase [Hasllibacter halocynthiae]|uniref:Dihydroorotase n=1 Tax=Hasllibacter halocynthiae TaxID=595589 RepID=A0A2T0X3T8_9RHOB|nr:dihydroorotase [Hasllibacter halocynthiae]PRY93601.1 dihydroorotase [Hasllibacter halocynthiae]